MDNVEDGTMEQSGIFHKCLTVVILMLGFQNISGYQRKQNGDSLKILINTSLCINKKCSVMFSAHFQIYAFLK